MDLCLSNDCAVARAGASLLETNFELLVGSSFGRSETKMDEY